MKAGPASARPLRIVYVVNTDWFFVSHRLPLARAMSDIGFHVTVIAEDTGASRGIAGAGFTFLPLPISSKSLNPIADIETFLFLVKAYRRLKPDLIHHITIKPVIYGSLAARFAKSVAVVNAITGLGYMFGSHWRARLLRPVVSRLYRAALKLRRSRTIFQNPESMELFVKLGLVQREQALLIRGSGVDCLRYTIREAIGDDRIVMLAGRMLWDKGVGEFVAAARTMRNVDPTVRFVLVGKPEEGQPSAVLTSQLEGWAREGVVEWWGHRDDMPTVLSRASVVVLPTTYKEGIPKVLLEAAACGRPLVATDVEGCREIVRPGVNGMLVPPGDHQALIDAILTLMADSEKRATYGKQGREIVRSEFSQEIVIGQTVAVYEDLLARVLAGEIARAKSPA